MNRDIIDQVINDIISEECNQPYLQDETICCLEEFNGCCCKCKYQLPIHTSFPVSLLYCFVCLKHIAGHFIINPTHGYCHYYSPNMRNSNDIPTS